MDAQTITDVHMSVESSGAAIVFPGLKPAGHELKPTLEKLAQVIKKEPESKKHTLEDESRWRAQKMREGRYAIRRLRDKVPDLDQLGLPQWIKALLLRAGMRDQGGLVVICGLTGAGKTTTWSATACVTTEATA